MSTQLINHSVNILSYIKDNKTYAMTACWVMQADYDKLVCLIGSQSETGNNLRIGDKLGISVLAKNQKDIALEIGNCHSSEKNKLDKVEYNSHENAITIKDASRELICEVIDIIKLKEIEEDNLIYVRVINTKCNNENFLAQNE